ncbi:hypothetical protein C8R44DRAFT_35703 [Mycena epipterygia]|nr:hypothetical protein C8R44DRAFT_35703 [Mycena epipterygia]
MRRTSSARMLTWRVPALTASMMSQLHDGVAAIAQRGSRSGGGSCRRRNYKNERRRGAWICEEEEMIVQGTSRAAPTPLSPGSLLSFGSLRSRHSLN